MRPHAKIIRSILSLGLASFAVQAGAAVVNFAVNFLLVKYGSASAIGAEGALASIGVVQRIAMFTVMPLVGVSIAIQPLLGFNYGAKIIARVRKTLWLGVAFATSLAVIMWALVHLFPNQIVGLFGITNASLADFTIFALKIQLLMLPLVGFRIVGSNYFPGNRPADEVDLSSRLTRQVLFPCRSCSGFPRCCLVGSHSSRAWMLSTLRRRWRISSLSLRSVSSSRSRCAA